MKVPSKLPLLQKKYDEMPSTVLLCVRKRDEVLHYTV